MDDRRIDKLLPEDYEMQPIISEEEKQRQYFLTTYDKANERLRQTVLPVRGGTYKSKYKTKSKTKTKSKKLRELIKPKATRKKHK